MSDLSSISFEFSLEKAILLVQSFLLDNNLVGAARALELESGIAYPCEHEDIQFLRELVLDARWSELEELLSLFYPSHGFDKRKVRYYILRQRLFELLCAKVSLDSSKLNNTLSSTWKNNQQANDSASSIVSLLSALETVCRDAKEFNSICFVLTQSSINDHPDYRNWTVHSGRKECYECIKTEVLRVMNLPLSKTSSPPPKHQFERILHQAAVAQTLSRIASDPRIIRSLPPLVPFDPLRENVGVAISADAYPIPEPESKHSGVSKAQAETAQILSNKDGIVHKLLSQSIYKLNPTRHTIPVPENKYSQPVTRSIYTSDAGMYPSDRLHSTLTSLHRSSILVPADGPEDLDSGAKDYPSAGSGRWSPSIEYPRQNEGESQVNGGSRSGGSLSSPFEDQLRSKRPQETPQSQYGNLNTTQNTTLLSTLRFKDLASVRTVLNSDARKGTPQERGGVRRYPQPVAAEATVPASSPLPASLGSELLSPPPPPEASSSYRQSKEVHDKSEHSHYSGKKQSVISPSSSYNQYPKSKTQTPFASPPPPVGEHYTSTEPLNASMQSVSSVVSYRRVEAPSPRRQEKLPPHDSRVAHTAKPPAYETRHAPPQHPLPPSPYTAPSTAPSQANRSRTESDHEPVSWVVPLDGKAASKPVLHDHRNRIRARTPVRTPPREPSRPGSPQSPNSQQRGPRAGSASADGSAMRSRHASMSSPPMRANASAASGSIASRSSPRHSRPPSQRSQYDREMESSNLHYARKLSFGGAYKEQYHPDRSISEASASEYDAYNSSVHASYQLQDASAGSGIVSRKQTSQPGNVQKPSSPVSVRQLQHASRASVSSSHSASPYTTHQPYRPPPGVVHYAGHQDGASSATPYSELGHSLPSASLGSTVETFPSYSSVDGAGYRQQFPPAALAQAHAGDRYAENNSSMRGGPGEPGHYQGEIAAEGDVEYVHSIPQRNGYPELSSRLSSVNPSVSYSPASRLSKYAHSPRSPAHAQHDEDGLRDTYGGEAAQPQQQPKIQSPYHGRPPTAPHPSKQQPVQQQQQVWYSPGKSDHAACDTAAVSSYDHAPTTTANSVLSGSLLSNRSFDDYLPEPEANERSAAQGYYQAPPQDQHSSVSHIPPYAVDILEDLPLPEYPSKQQPYTSASDIAAVSSPTQDRGVTRSPSSRPESRGGHKNKDRPGTAASLPPKKGDTSRTSLPRGYPGFVASTGSPHWVVSLLYNSEMDNYSYDSNDEECYRMSVPNSCAKQLRDIMQMDADTVFVGTQPVRTAVFDPAPLSIHQTLPANDDLNIHSLIAIGTNSKSLVFNTIHTSITGRIPEHDEFSLVPGGGVISGVSSTPERKFSEHHLGSVYSTDWTYLPDDRHFSSPLVATASNDMTVKLVKLGKSPHGQLLPEASPVMTLNANSGTLRSVCFLGGRTAHTMQEDTNGLHVAVAGGGDFSVKVWDVQAFSQASQHVSHDRSVWESIRESVTRPFEAYHGHTNVVYGVAPFDQQGRHFTSVSADGCVALWDTRIRNRIPAYLYSLTGRDSGAWCLPSQALPTHSVTNAVQLHSVAVTKSVPGIQRSLAPGTVGPREIVVGGADGRIAVVDIVAGKIVLSKKVHSDSIRSLDAIGPLIISASDDESIVISTVGDDINTIGRERFHADKVLSARFHHELPMALTSSADKTAMISSFHVGPGSHMM